MHIGKRIQTLMKLRGVTPSAMAVHCEVTRGAVSNWFVKGRVSKDNLSKVAEKLRTTTDRLIKYDVEEILELEEVDRKKGAKAIGPLLDGVRSEVGRQQYSLAALEMAFMFDRLPGELARSRVTAFVENLLVRNPALEAEAARIEALANSQLPKKRSSAKPKATRRPVPKTSRARVRS